MNIKIPIFSENKLFQNKIVGYRKAASLYIFVNLRSVQLSGLSGGSVVKNPPADEGGIGDAGSIPGSGRSAAGGMATVFLPGESRGQRSLVGSSPWGCKELDTAERLSTHTHLAHQLDLSISPL